tara:strand:+ start:1714 stop:2223 length:510 start_codon:yes stop_codon:yes gene_type:complete
MNSPHFIAATSALKNNLPKKISFKRISKARTYLFLTLGSVFFFAIVYYLVQKIKPDKNNQTSSIQTKAYGNEISDKAQMPAQQNKEIAIPTTDVGISSLSHWESGTSGSLEKLNVPDGELPFFGCLLFSLVTQTTVGYAWFVPTDDLTRLVVFFQILTIVFIACYTLMY